MRLKVLVLPLIMVIYGGSSFADNVVQNVTESNLIASRINSNPSTRIMCTSTLRCSSSLTTQFYKAYNYQYVWVNNGNLNPDISKFLAILDNSYQDGLNPNDYHVQEIHTLLQKISEVKKESGEVVTQAQLTDLELTLSDAYLLYLRHIEIGRVDPQSSYPTWQVNRRKVNVVDQYLYAARQNKLISTLTNSVPTTTQYQQLKQQLAIYQKIAQNGGWENISAGNNLQLGSSGMQVELLQKRLAATESYNFQASSGVAKFNQSTKNAVMDYQRENGIKVTGIVDKATIQALNVSVKSRIKQIQLNLDRLRWLPTSLGSQYIWVNIPSYSLEIINSGSKSLQMPVIVGGGGENKTCAVSSVLTTMELNPYWGIPNRIATKEYLGKIQQDPEYLTKRNIRVFSSTTKQEVDPSTINWESVNPNKFNYFLRQDPGKRNALGKVKFLFANNCGIYLHDTSNPNLFSRNARSLSHGCIRVSQPIELANYLVSDNSNWNSAKIDKTIKSGDHTWVKLADQLPIHIVYQTVVVGSNGRLEFKKDIYNADNVDFPVYLPQQSESNNASK